MMLDNLMFWTVCLAVGLVLGVFYFGGLWLTMKRLPGSSHPVLLLLLSYFGRVAVMMCALLLLALGGGWQWLVATLLGFLAVKLAMILRLGPSGRGPMGGISGGIGAIREVEDGNQP